MLRVHAKNHRYLDNGSGKPLYLVSSHTWMIDWDLQKWLDYLRFCRHWGLNFIRMWSWEHNRGDIGIWVRESDGRSNLDKLDQKYFDSLRAFVSEADRQGLYVSVMVFQGFSGALPNHDFNLRNWTAHPMNKKNNVNGIDGDPEGKGYGTVIHSIDHPDILRYWEAYVSKLVDTLNDFDNMIWEMGNEDPYPPFTRYFIDCIRERERTMRKQHLIYYSAGSFTGNDAVFSSSADIYGPQADDLLWGTKDDLYYRDPPVVSHGKPEFLDNDHLGNHVGVDKFTPLDQRNWTWKAFLRGYHPWHMDGYDVAWWLGMDPVKDHPIPGVSTLPQWDPQRKSLGDTLRYANKLKHLADAIPTDDKSICSTGYCLFCPGKEYLAYQPEPLGSISLDIAPGSYTVESYNPVDDSVESRELIGWAGGLATFAAPQHCSEDWVIHIWSTS
ncbi:MAG: hypothetical protein GXX08_05260 [Firmicutes bacterium]|nr:hypothetical protein [Bacillota bacterium]